jgi:mannitol-1-phosphate 5-dehydrogenase
VRAVIVGAGKIGCGYLAPLFLQAGWEVVLAGRSEESVRRMRARGRYRVRVTGSDAREVSGFRAVRFGTSDFVDEVSDAHLLVTAVGVGNVAGLAPSLACALANRGRERPLQVWVVENQDCAPVLQRAVRKAAATRGLQLPSAAFVGGIADVAVARGSWADGTDPEFVRDGASRLRLDAARLDGPLPRLPGVSATKHYRARLEEKLYVFNAGHALCAYLGALRGHRFVHQAVADPMLRPLVAGCLLESRNALLTRWPVLGEDSRRPVADALRRYENEELADATERVARDPIRKLGPEDRLVGPARLIVSARKRVPAHFALGIAGALLYRVDGDKQALQLSERLRRDGLAPTLYAVSGLAPEGELAKAVARRYHGFILTAEGAVFPPVHAPAALASAG